MIINPLVKMVVRAIWPVRKLTVQIGSGDKRFRKVIELEDGEFVAIRFGEDFTRKTGLNPSDLKPLHRGRIECAGAARDRRELHDDMLFELGDLLNQTQGTQWEALLNLPETAPCDTCEKPSRFCRCVEEAV